MPLLHFDRITDDGADPERWLLVLAGIYGAGRNWGSVARQLVRARPDWGAVPVDLRGHGSSPAMDPPHTVEAAAADLAELVEAEGIAAGAILGHSFGGKVALLYARRRPEGLRRVFVIDSTPDAREPGGSAWTMLGVLREHPGPFSTREAVVAAIEDAGFAAPVARWMSTNVERGDDEAYRWRVDLEQMEALLRDFFREDAWDIVENPPTGCEIHVVKASESSVLTDAAAARIEAAAEATGRVHLHRIEGGHWLNADNPGAVLEVLMDAL